MSTHHLRNNDLSLKAKVLLSQMLSMPEDWDYTLKGLAFINREQIDAIREAVRQLERVGYIVRSRERDEKGRLRGADYVIYETQQLTSDLPTLNNPTLDNPTQKKPMQLNKDIFHDYSLNNTLLILLQKPDASLVAGYGKWRDDFERHVKAEEKGIKIFVPAHQRI